MVSHDEPGKATKPFISTFQIPDILIMIPPAEKSTPGARWRTTALHGCQGSAYDVDSAAADRPKALVEGESGQVMCVCGSQKT